MPKEAIQREGYGGGVTELLVTLRTTSFSRAGERSQARNCHSPGPFHMGIKLRMFKQWILKFLCAPFLAPATKKQPMQLPWSLPVPRRNLVIKLFSFLGSSVHVMCRKCCPSSFRCSGWLCCLLGSGLKTWIPSTRDSLVLSQSLILTLYVCMGVAVLRVKLEYRAPWDPWTENKNVRGHVSKGKHGCKCPGYLPIASAWKKGCFLPFYVFCNKSSVWMPL